MKKPRWKPAMTLLSFIIMAVPITAMPEIKSFDKVATLEESTLVNEKLSTIVCTDPDGLPTRTSVQLVNPGSPCGNCFTVLDCGSAECLQYRAGVGRLDHDITGYYLITVGCENTARETATEVIQIVIIPNTPPKFDSLTDSFSISAKKGPGDTVGKVPAEDDDDDLLSYSLSVIPALAHSAFAIDSSGTITAMVDLRTLCRSFVTLLVTVSDGYNTIGPKVVNVAFSDNSVVPIATNLNTELQVREDETGTIFTYQFVPNKDLTYTVTSTNTAGFAQFESDDELLKVATPLNYEEESLRVTDLLIKATDGYCESETYTLTVRVTDVNEAPVIDERVTNIELCEGRTEFVPPFTMTDEDEEENHVWTYVGGNNRDGLFFINPETGVLGTNIDYDVDPDYNKPKKYGAKFAYKIMVTDKGGLTATATVSATFLDCNDNAPRFRKAFWTYTASECTGPGSILGRISATDADSSREGNNELEFSGAAGAVEIGGSGRVILNQALSAGSVVVFDAWVTDKGLTPGALRSINPAKISVIFTICPVPSAGDGSGDGDSLPPNAVDAVRDNLSWIVIAALLGVLMVGVISFMLWRYWDIFGESCRRIDWSRVCRRGPPKRSPDRINTKRQPARKPDSEAPAPKRAPTPAGPSFLFGFWKERFPNDDYRHQPDRKRLPTPADMHRKETNTYDPVEPPPSSVEPPPPQAQPKTRFCNIL